MTFLEKTNHSPSENGGLCQFNKDWTRKYHVCEVQPDGSHRGWVVTEQASPAAHPEAAASDPDHPAEAEDPEGDQR